MTPEEYALNHWDENTSGTDEQELTLSEAVSIVDAFIVFDEKNDRLDEALRKVNEYADNMGGFTGDKTRLQFKRELEAKLAEEHMKGGTEGIKKVEDELFGDLFYNIRSIHVRIENISEIVFKDTHGNEVQFEPVTKGYWEVPEPDFDREGTRLPVKVAICSNCQKPSKLPTTRFCPNCGSWNKDNGNDYE